jgi:hypothetical protein
VTPELRGVWENIRDLGLGAMQHALRLSLYFHEGNPKWPALSVLSAAHAAELLIKARIAYEHPLLIFDTTHKTQSGDALDFAVVASEGRTFQYNDLPARLWAATGIRVPRESEYRDFGKLRNIVQHFAEPDEDLSARTVRFVFDVIDPFIGEQWELFAVDYNEEHGEHYEHIIEILVELDVRPRLSPAAIENWKGYRIPQKAPPGYRQWFEDAVGARDRDT